MCETLSWRLEHRPLPSTLHKHLYLWSEWPSYQGCAVVPMKESIPFCFALIFPMVMKQAETICTFHLEIMCTTSLQTIFVCCISNFVFLPFGSIYIYLGNWRIKELIICIKNWLHKRKEMYMFQEKIKNKFIISSK